MAAPPEHEATATPRWLAPLICLALGLAVLVATAGCGGCSKDPAEVQKERERKLAEERERKRKEEEEKKPDFEGVGGRLPRLETRPCVGSMTSQRSESPVAPYKPGHWTATNLELKANHFDFLGDLEITAARPRGEPIPIEGTSFDLATCRQVSLVKKKSPKCFESVLFVPSEGGFARGSWRLVFRQGGRQALQTFDALGSMPPYQYHLVVIAAYPESYAYLKTLASVEPPTDTFAANPVKPFYRVSLLDAAEPDRGRRLSLPSYGLLWTSIAEVVWDGAEPGALDPFQQQALLDWLHWGGQLIVSGPGSLDKLHGSFLEPYLPATAGEVRQLTADEFEAFHQWSTAEGKSLGRLAPPPNWTGVELERHADARAVPGSGGLLVERRVGRGRIVVSAFGLAGRALRTWQGVDEMVNAFLFRRPPREFVQTGFDDVERGDMDLEDVIEVKWADDRYAPLDAGCICGLRYFSRDLREGADGTAVAFGPYLQEGVSTESFAESAVYAGSMSLGETAMPHGGGVAAWNDFNPVANSARATLQNAAEIEIPSRGFVIEVVVGYLLVLVPVNWAVFRLINRVEFAWVAAPLIAVAWTVVVIRLAQLDIGFARSRTEIAVVELQGEYPRAHVTRYTALYTSLTTSYECRSEDPGVLVLPFPEAGQLESSRRRDRQTLVFRRGTDASLAGYPVQSNSTGMLHTEQMVDLGGPLALEETASGRFQLANRTLLTLHDVGVVRRDARGSLWVALVGRPLKAGGAVSLTFRPWSESSASGPLWHPWPEDNLLGRVKLPGAEASVPLSLVEMAQDVGQLERRQVRLVAWTEEEIPGLEIRPAAPQTRSAALVIAHFLKDDFGEDPRPDRNLLPAGLGDRPETGYDMEGDTPADIHDGSTPEQES